MAVRRRKRKHSLLKATSTGEMHTTTQTIHKGGLVFDVGTFKANNVVLYEAAINKTVLRIHISDSCSVSTPRCIKPKLSKKRKNGDAVKVDSVISDDDDDDDVNVDRKDCSTLESIPMNDSVPLCTRPKMRRKCASNNATVKRYVLQMPPKRYIVSHQSRLALEFTSLKSALPTLKLPKSNWKIRVWLCDDATTRIVITNNQQLERSVTFTAKTNYYKLIVDSMPVYLLGSPKYLSTVKDIEILLNLLQCIDQNDCMLQKLNDR